MARKPRNNVDYFPHSVTHGKKMFYIRSKYKNDGYAVWFMLMEELGKADYHYLDLNDEIQIMYLSSSFMVEEIVLKAIIEDLVKFGDFNKQLWEKESILFNEKFIENISDAYSKRTNNAISLIELKSLLKAKGRIKSDKLQKKPDSLPPIDSINPQSKVKYSKVNKTKEKESKEYNNEVVVPTPKKEPKLESLFSLMRKEFELFYEDLKFDKYYFEAKDGSALKSIIKKLTFSIKNKTLNEPTEAEILSTFKMFLGKITDKWILNNLSLTILNSKYNEQIAAIKEGRTTSGKKPITDNDIMLAAEKRFGKQDFNQYNG